MSQKEIEIRFRLSEIKKDEIMKLLQNKGWSPKRTKQIDTYFCSPEFVKQKERPYIVRIRESETKKILTYKSTIINGVWEEIETQVEDAVSVKKILGYLNLESFLVIDKERLTGKVSDIEINIDQIKDLGLYVEFEVISDDVEKGKKRILNFSSQLNLELNDIVNGGYVQLMERKH